MTRSQLIQKRAQEEAVLMLVTGINYKNYPMDVMSKIKYALSQFKAAINNIKNYRKTTQRIKQILLQQREHFRI